MINLFDAPDCYLSEPVTLNIDGDFNLELHPDNTVFSESGGNIQAEWTFPVHLHLKIAGSKASIFIGIKLI